MVKINDTIVKRINSNTNSCKKINKGIMLEIIINSIG